MSDRNPDPAVILHVGGASDVGRVRQVNEDSMLRDDDARVYAVADGMGGHKAGEVASKTAIDAVKQHLVDTTPESAGEAVGEAVSSANDSVFAMAEEDPELRGMGTTLTAMVVDGHTALIGHVGDSRAYLLRDGELTQVTEDHSLVEELVREGRLTPEEAAVHPQRSIITRAIGVDDSVEVATYEVDLRHGDRLLLCSDGLTSMVRDTAIGEVLTDEADTQAAADRLIEAANAAGGDDNITVLVVDVERDPAAERDQALAASEAVPADAGEKTGEWEQLPDELAGPDDDEVIERGEATGYRRWRRLALYIVPALVIITIAFAALGWYARRTYFVGFEDNRVALFQGVPDGFLMWDPTVESLTRLTPTELSDADLEAVRGEREFSSRGSAEEFVERLQRKAVATTTTTTTSTTSTTTAGEAPPDEATGTGSGR